MRPFARRAPTILVGDVGGTHTRFGLFGTDLTRVRVWPTSETQGLRAAFGRYQHDVGAPLPDVACIAVAGPVDGRRARLTNVGWEGSEDELAFPTRLVNDLHAAAAGIHLLGDDDLLHLGGDKPRPDAPAVIIGIGTGFGAALRVGDTVIPGELGHADLAPANADQDDLVRWLRRRNPGAPVRWEDAVSGPGLANLLSYIQQRVALSKPAQKALDSGDMPPEAVVTGWWASDAACAQAAALLVSLTAGAARGLALQSLAFGGVHICGGLPPRLADLFADDDVFRDVFEAGGPMHSLLTRVPVHLVTHEYLPLLGASVLGQAMMRS